MAKIDAFGTQLQVSSGGATPTWTTIAGLTNIDGPGVTREILDATSHDSPNNAREKKPGLKDGGEVSIEGYYDPASGTHNTATGLAGFAQSGAVKDFRVVDTNAAGVMTTFSGFISEFRRTAPMENLLGFTSTIVVTGVPVFP